MTHADEHHSSAPTTAGRTALLAVGGATVHHVLERHRTSMALSAPGGQ